MACFFAVTSNVCGCLAFSWVPISVFNPLGLTFFQLFRLPTDSFEVIVHIDTRRPLQLCYNFCSMLHLCSVLFSYVAVLDLHDSGQNMFGNTCSYLVRCVAFSASCVHAAQRLSREWALNRHARLTRFGSLSPKRRSLLKKKRFALQRCLLKTSAL